MYGTRLVAISNTVEVADTDILTTALGPFSKIPGLLRVTVAYSVAAIFSLRITPEGSTAVSLLLNEGNALVAEALYTFDIPVQRGDVANFRFSAGGTIRILSVSGIAEGV